MSRYESAYGKNWESLDKQEAINRAYALGVGTALDEYHPAELDAIRAEMANAYDKSVVELAFDEGKNEGRKIKRGQGEDNEKIWAQLVEGGGGDVAETPTDEPAGLPDSISRAELLERRNLDTTQATELPEFLRKD
jgi:hypothetical protein